MRIKKKKKIEKFIVLFCKNNLSYNIKFYSPKQFILSNNVTEMFSTLVIYISNIIFLLNESYEIYECNNIFNIVAGRCYFYLFIRFNS